MILLLTAKYVIVIALKPDFSVICDLSFSL